MSTIASTRRARVVVGLATGGVLALAIGTTASAHVSIAEDEVAAGSYSLLTFGIPHGCDGSPTTEVRIQLPESIPEVTPTVNPNWDVEKVMTGLAEPLDDGYGGQLTERVSEVVYTATTPLAADLRDAFVLSLKIPDDAAGSTLSFPTIQTCEAGETAWIEETTAGGAEPEHPAPSVAVVDADAAAGATEVAVEAAAVTEEQPAVVAADDGGGDGPATGLAIAGLVAGLGGLALGGVALARSRRP